MTEKQQLESAIAMFEAQRALLGDAVVETALAPLRIKLAALSASAPPGPGASATVAPAPKASHGAAAGGTQTLKAVSILFLDIVGSTTLSQKLDPEEIHEVMDGALTKCTDIVLAHRGKVLQYAGDNLLAVFGADASREDDVENAVLCGLALLQEGLRQGEWVLRHHQHAGFNVRVGLHTGGVLLGGGVDAEGSIRGIGVNIAARMEQTAPAGALRISHDTYRHVRGLFAVQAQDPIAVKGVDEPIQTYLVHGRKERSFFSPTRGIEGIRTPMVGRDAPLQQLKNCLAAQAQQASQGHAPEAGAVSLRSITVVAEAGVGKSRLTQEFMQWLQAQRVPHRLLLARALPSTQQNPFGLLRDLICTWLRILDGDSAETARQKLNEQVAAFFVADEGAEMAQAHAHVLGQLLGFDFSESPHVKGILQEGKQIRDRAFNTVAQMLRRASTAALAGASAPQQVMVLVLDDLHWSDDGSLGFVLALCKACQDIPVMVLGLTRPELYERRADWGQGLGQHSRIDLQPLNDDSSQALALALLRRIDDVPAALLRLVTQRAQGNPFYMEELVKMLMDEGAIVVQPTATEQAGAAAADASPPRWRVLPEKLVSTNVPATLTGVLQARLDRLSVQDKLSLQEASVIGLHFWRPILEAIDPDSSDSLPTLTERALVVPLGSKAAQQESSDEVLEAIDYAFKHQILHKVTYDSVLKRAKRIYHRRAAEWMVGMLGRAGDDHGLIAHHFEQAGDNADAAAHYARATESALAAFAHGLVEGFAAKVLTLTEDSDHALRWRALAARQRSLRLQGKTDAQLADVAALDALAEIAQNLEWQAIVAVRQSTNARLYGTAGESYAAAHRALETAFRSPAVEWQLVAYTNAVKSAMGLGKLDEAREMAQQGLALARSAQFRIYEGELLEGLGRVSMAAGDTVSGQAYFRQHITICKETGQRSSETSALNNLGDASFRLGAYGQALQDLMAANRLAKSLGLSLMEAITCINLSGVHHFCGRPVEAVREARHAHAIATRERNDEYLGFAAFYLGLAHGGALEWAEARQYLEQAVSLFSKLALSVSALEAGVARGHVALASGSLTEAMAFIEPTLNHVVGGGNLAGAEHPALLQWTCYRVLQTAQDPRAKGVLTAACAELQARAAAIPGEAARAAFLGDVPHHRALLAELAAAG